MMATNSNSLEYQALQKMFDSLVNVLENNVEEVARKAFSKNLISKDNEKDAEDQQRQNSKTRASKLLHQILSKIDEKGPHDHFDTFVTILEEVPVLKDQADELKREIFSCYSGGTAKTPLQLQSFSSSSTSPPSNPLSPTDSLCSSLSSQTSSIFSQVQKKDRFLGKNESHIKHSFHTLVKKVAEMLPEKGVDIDEFQTAMFDSNNEPYAWSEEKFDDLQAIVDGYNDPELSHEIVKFEEEELCGYWATKQIAEFIDWCKHHQGERAKPNDQLPDIDDDRKSELTICLDVIVTDQTLIYVHRIWRRFARVSVLPPLSAVLELITPGSIRITWRITDEAAYKIRDKAKTEAVIEFFRKERITLVLIDDECVYEEEENEMLVLACRAGNLDEVEGLLKKGLDVNAMLKESELRGVHFAAMDGSYDLMGHLIEAGADLTVINKEGKTALHLAVENGHEQVVEILVNAEGGCAANAVDKSGDTALSLAVKNNRIDIVTVLVKQRNDVIDLHLLIAARNIAVEKGYQEIAEVLVEEGAVAEREPQEAGSIFASFWSRIRRSTQELRMLWSARLGKVDNVRSCLERGANPNYTEKDFNHWTSLMWASNNGHAEIVKILLEKGADPNYKAAGGWTALILASRNGHHEVVELLTDPVYKVDLNAKNTYGWTALMWASQYRDYLGIVASNKPEKKEKLKKVAELLVERGADPNIAANNGWTPAMQASQDGHSEFIDTLGASQIKCDIDTKAKKGMFALMVAALKGHADVVVALARQGANLNQTNEKQLTALHIACDKGHDDVTQQLIQHGAIIDVRDQSGITPLIVAIKKKRVKIVGNLLDAGADVNMQAHGYADWTPLMFAAKSGDKDIISAVLSKNPDLSITDARGCSAVAIMQAFHEKFVELLTKHLKEKLESEGRFQPDVDEETLQKHIDKILKESLQKKVSPLDKQYYRLSEVKHNAAYRLSLAISRV